MPQPRRTAKTDRIDELEALWALILRVGLCIAGVVILLGNVFVIKDPPTFAWLAGLALCGPVTAASVATMLEALRGGSAP